jgi:hypothetical protein
VTRAGGGGRSPGHCHLGQLAQQQPRQRDPGRQRSDRNPGGPQSRHRQRRRRHRRRRPATTLTRNIANHNHDLGIEAVPGVIDGGGNTPRPTVTLGSARILTVNSGQVASGGLPGTIFACRQREGVRRSFWPPCHRRATSNGQSRYPADNHGHSGAAHELGRLRSASLNASREYA